MAEPELITTRLSQDNQVVVAQQQYESLMRFFTEADAVNLSNFARFYANPSPELAAGVAQAGISWDDPLLSEISMRDAEEQERPFWDLLHQGSRVLKPAIRGAAALAEGVWEEGLPRLTRTAIQAYQNPGQSLVDSWRDAGASDLAYGIGELSQGNEVNWGEGFFPQSTPAHEQIGFGQDLAAGIQADAAQGIEPTQAFQQNVAALSEDYESRFGREVTYYGQQIRSNTIIHKTRGGETYSSPFSFGRAAAIQVATPGSTAFNMISGGIDFYTRIAWDPLNVPADELMKWNKARDLIIPANASEAGLVTYRRPWVNPRTATEWLASGRGRKRITYLANNTDIAATRKMIPGMDLGDQIRLTALTDEADIINALRPYMESPQSLTKAPTVSRQRLLTSRIRNSNDFVSHLLPEQNSLAASTYRRLTASSGDQIINVYDVDRSVDTMIDYLDTIEATVTQKNRIIQWMYDAAGDPIKMRGVVEEYKEVLKVRLDDLGYDPVEIKMIMDQYTELQVANTEYLINLAGDTIEMQGSGNYRVLAPDGTPHLIRLTHAAHDVEIASQMVVLPNMRNTRLVSSRIRAWNHRNFRSRMGWDPKGAYISTGVRALDRGQSIWRNFALIRGGWMMRIVGEEAVRRQAAGYGMFLGNPIEVIALVSDSNMRGIASIDTLNDYFEMHSLGASGFRVDAQMNPLKGTKFDATRSSWDVVPAVNQRTGLLTDRGRAGLAGELHRAARSQMHQQVALRGLDEAVEFFKTPAGLDELARIRRETANVANPMGRLVDDVGQVDEKLLRQHLEYIAADQARLRGGDFIYREPNSDVWLNSMGNPIDDPRNMSNAEIQFWLKENSSESLLRGPNGQFRSMGSDEFLADVYEAMNLPDLNFLQGTDTFAHVTNEGSEAVKNLLGYGDSAGPTSIPQLPKLKFIEDPDLPVVARTRANGEITINPYLMQQEWVDGLPGLRLENGGGHAQIFDELGIDVDDFKAWLDERGGPSAWEHYVKEHERTHQMLHMDPDDLSEAGVYARELEADRLALERIGYLEPGGGRLSQIDAQLPDGVLDWLNAGTVSDDEIIAMFSWADDSTEARLLKERRRLQDGEPSLQSHGDMTLYDQTAFELRLDELYPEGVNPPAHVRIPKGTQQKRIRSTSQKISDFMFHSLGEVPTMKFIRQPFAKVRYTEEMARAYVWSDDATRLQLKAWATKYKVPGLFDTFVQRHLDGAGLKKLPTGIDEAFSSFDDLDRIVLGKVIEDTKDLFYDLTRKQNWADAVRFIAPFADAWQEVLSRWIKMQAGAGPGGPGQAVRNWERLRQGGQQASQSSFFGEDQFGNEVFNFPAAGMLMPGLSATIQATARPEQLLFIDPSVRSVMGPGTGPLIQIGAAFVKPVVKKFMGQQAADSMDSFLFGDFASPRLDGPMELVKVVMPSWMKRTMDQYFADENEREYADEIMQVYSALLNSGDPRYAGQDKEAIDRRLDEARSIGTQLGMARILDAMLLPALPRYEPGVFVDIANHPDGGFWLTTAALGNDLRIAEDLFGDRDTAVNYILDTYGLDPLNVTSKTYSIRQRPTTVEGLQYLNDHPELKTTFNNTLMMFIPEGAGDAFYYTAWSEAIAEGNRVTTAPEVGAQMIARAKGQMRWGQLVDEYDAALEQGRKRFGEDSQTFRNYRDELDEWRSREKLAMSVNYYSWDSPVEGQITRPTYEDLFTELRQAGTPGSDANELAKGLDPELVGFLEFSTSLWNMLNEEAINRGFGHDWWRTSDAASPDRAREVFELRDWFSRGVEQEINKMSGQSRLGAEWVAEYVYSRLIQGAEFDDEVFIAVTEPPAPRSLDSIEESPTDEILAPAGLEQP